MRTSLVLGLRHFHRTRRWRHRVPLAFPVLARGGGRWGRARSPGHQAIRASPAPRAALIPARRAPEQTRAALDEEIVALQTPTRYVLPMGPVASHASRHLWPPCCSPRPLRYGGAETISTSPEWNGRAIRSRFHHLEVSCSSLAFY